MHPQPSALHPQPSRVLALLVFTVAVALLFPEIGLACPSCKQALASQDPSQGDIVSGYFWSILFMMSMPFTILGSLSGYMYLLVRRANADKAAKEGTPGQQQGK